MPLTYCESLAIGPRDHRDGMVFDLRPIGDAFPEPRAVVHRVYAARSLDIASVDYRDWATLTQENVDGPRLGRHRYRFSDHPGRQVAT